MIDNAIARNGYELFKDGNKIGFVNIWQPEPNIKKRIGLCYIKAEYSKADNEFDVNIRDKLYKAKTVKLPFYKRDKGV